jgi:hypothetical protein
LRDLADQNWNYVQLLQPPTSGVHATTEADATSSSSFLLPTLAWEKSVVAQVQEILSMRIEYLMDKGFVWEESQVSMEELCLQLTQTQTATGTTIEPVDHTPLNDVTPLGLDGKATSSTVAKVDNTHLPQYTLDTTKDADWVDTRGTGAMDTTMELKHDLDTVTSSTPMNADEIYVGLGSQVSKGEEGWAQLYG